MVRQFIRSATRSWGLRCRADSVLVTSPAATAATMPDASSSSAGR